MAEQRFDIVFNGVVRPGFDPEQARDNVAALFRTTRDKVAGLFSGSEVVLKRGVDQATAEKYRSTLHNAGVLCRARPVAGAAQPAPAPAAPRPAPAAAAPAASAASASGGAAAPQPDA
ncbi:MAG TPA: hypothetical protein VIW02_07075, partial [Gammaproteobacteria bacterium]